MTLPEKRIIDVRKIKLGIYFSCLTAVIFLIFHGYSIFNQIERVEGDWADFKNKYQSVEISLNALGNQFGYGGFIHKFNNLILRRDLNLIPELAKSSNEITIAISKLEAFYTEDSEKTALNKIKMVYKGYFRNIDLIKKNIRKSPVELDRIVRIDDSEAIGAYQFLRQENEFRRTEYESDLLSALSGLRKILYLGIALIPIAGLVAYFMLSFISRMMNALDQVSKKQAEIDRIIEFAPDGMLTIDSKGNVIRTNARIEELFGFSKEELTHINQMIPEGLEPFNSILVDDYFNGPSIRPMGMKREVFGRKKSGEIFSVEVGITFQYSDEGPRAMATIRDVTDRKKTEEESVKARELAEQASREKSDFIASVSHEIRTPLNSIVGLSEELLSSDIELQAKDYVTRLARNANYLFALINDVLDFSKLEAKAAEVEEIPINIRALLGNLMESFKIGANRKKIDLNLEIKSNMPELLLGDPTKVYQILANLVGNAIKFTSQGSVKIESEFKPEKSELQIKIRDTGIGIEKKNLERIFDRFQQADNSITRKFSGTGLGLAISKRLIELMKGEIGVTSKTGKGSVFFFTIPMKVQENRALESLIDLNSTRKVKAKAMNILVVDDSDDNCFLLKTFLKAEPYILEYASNGVEAVEKIKKGCYDVVLMDIQMPVMDGFEATRLIRAWEAENNEKPNRIFALTAMVSDQDKMQCKEMQFNEFLSKPVKKKILLELLANISLVVSEEKKAAAA